MLNGQTVRDWKRRRLRMKGVGQINYIVVPVLHPRALVRAREERVWDRSEKSIASGNKMGGGENS